MIPFPIVFHATFAIWDLAAFVITCFHTAAILPLPAVIFGILMYLDAEPKIAPAVAPPAALLAVLYARLAKE